MKQITIRDFQRDFYNQIKELPLTVAKNKQDLFVVLSVGEYEKLTAIQRKVATTAPQPKNVDTLLKELASTERCSWMGCHEEAVGHDKVNGRPFCKEHI